jgi:WS/DGAT/MGAT family acyltransferase
VLDRLSTRDAAFLYIGEGGDQVTFGWFAVRAGPDDGRKSEDLVEAVLRRRLSAMPRLRKQVKKLPFGLGLPIWVDDPSFDLSRHLHVLAVPSPADIDVARTVAAQVFESPLPCDRPPWDLHLLTGMAGNQVAVVQRVHHALADGIASAALALGLMDPGPPPTAVVATVNPSRRALLVDNLRWRWRTLVHAASPLGTPQRWLRTLGALGSELKAVGGRQRSMTSLNGPVGGTRRLQAVDVPLQLVRDIGHLAGATINDVLIAAVGGGVRAVLEARGEPTAVAMRAAVPVSLRSSDDADAVGNRTSGFVVPLHVGESDAATRLRLIAAVTRDLKQSAGRVRLMSLIDSPFLPAALLRRYPKWMRKQNLVHLTITNVPGPNQPLRLGGLEVLRIEPIVPLQNRVTIGVGALSYAGILTIGICVDPAWVGEHDLLVEGIRACMDDLAGHFGLGLSPSKPV